MTGFPVQLSPEAIRAVQGLAEKVPSAGLSALPKGSFGWRASKGPQESNLSGFRASGHRLLCKPEEVEQTLPSGIVLVNKTVQGEKNMATVVTVIEIGHDAWMDKVADFCQVGDKVLIGQYVGKFHTSPKDGKEYRFISDLDVISTIEE